MFKSLLKKLFATAAIVPLMASGQHKPDYIPPYFADSDRLAKMQAIFPTVSAIYKDYAEKNHFPGYAFGIVVDGKLVYSGGGGYLDIDKKIPATPKSFFRIASMTKSFTAMAILKLRDAGKLKLDDPVYLYIPEMKNQQLTQDAPVITIRTLLTHASGLPQDDPWGDRKLAESDAELIAFLKNGVSFSNVTGTNYEYSNLAYAMLGYIIKKVSGQSYEQYIADHIWQPLGMKQATWEYTKVPPADLAHGYRWMDDHWREEALLHDGTFGAMGGMLTSIESFSHYVGLHQSAWPARNDADTGPLKRSSIREMHQPWRFHELLTGEFADGSASAVTRAYGYGLAWSRNNKGREYVGHTGGLPGFGSNWLILPEYGVGVIFFANVTYAPAEVANLHALDALINGAGLQPRQLPVSRILQERQQALVKLLPDWKNAAASGIFANNFFLDHSAEALQQEAAAIFANAGKIQRVTEVVPENQLRGYFMLEGEKSNIKISFTLSPENPALIQHYEIKAMAKA